MSSHNTNTDLTEEDAADLQFPKGKSCVSTSLNKSRIQLTINECVNCENELGDTFIICVVCDINICTICFSSGVEFSEHKNDHNYSVLNNNFALFDNSEWTAKEEMILLNGILMYNNFDLIVKDLPNRTVKDIKNHYNYYYTHKHGSELFPNNKLANNDFMEPIAPYNFKLDSQDPVRGKINQPAGYNAARSDFEYDYDRHAEDVIANLELCEPSDPFYNLISELQVAIVNKYRRKVLERQRRKSIIRKHGLIMQQKTISWLNRYFSTITPAVYMKLLRFMQFYTGQGFELIMEGLHRVGELKLQINRLCDFRKKGIQTLEEIQLYLKLKQHREESLRDLKRFYNITELSIKMKTLPIPISVIPKKRNTNPLEIIGMAGYEKLLPKESDLCRVARLTPLSYLELKAILIAENNKMGFLKLFTARKLLKIDVNKTRKLYDFLIQEGYIQKPKD